MISSCIEEAPPFGITLGHKKIVDVPNIFIVLIDVEAMYNWICATYKKVGPSIIGWGCRHTELADM